MKLNEIIKKRIVKKQSIHTDAHNVDNDNKSVQTIVANIYNKIYKIEVVRQNSQQFQHCSHIIIQSKQ
jgi:hypothetical protein